MEKPRNILDNLVPIFVVLMVIVSVSGQQYTVQDIADMQNQVVYEMFDFFHYSQERQLTTVFEKLDQLEARLLQVERLLGLEGSVNASAVAGFVRPTSIYRPDPTRRKDKKKKPPQKSQVTAFPRYRPVGRVTPTPEPRPTTTKRPRTPVPVLPTQPPYARTCAEIHAMGLLANGEPMFSIDPLRNNQLLNVVCEKTTRPRDGRTVIYTVVGHSQMRSTQVNGFEEPGSFSLKPRYEATEAQLKALTAASHSCSQFIAYRCRGSVLMVRSSDTGTTYGWWETIDGDRVESWGGAAINSTMCACGRKGTCAKPGTLCNCDSNGRGSDEGFITQKEFLPVRDVRLGDTGGQREMGYIQLGALRCEG